MQGQDCQRNYEYTLRDQQAVRHAAELSEVSLHSRQQKACDRHCHAPSRVGRDYVHIG